MNSSFLTILIGCLLGFLSCTAFVALNIRNLRQMRASVLSRINDAETILNNQIAQINITELLQTEAGKELLVILEDTSLFINNENEANLLDNHIQEKLEQAIQEVGKQEGNSFSMEIQPIILRNHERGRIKAFLNSPNVSLQDYIQKVVDNYKRRSQYIHELQVEKSNEAWESLLKDMQKWAYQFLVKKGYEANGTTWENAKECATEAALSMLRADFPYDTEFEPWVRVVVQNACLKFIHRNASDTSILEESIDDLERSLQSIKGSMFRDENSTENEDADLFQAVAQLSGLQRQVIEMKYFQNLSSDEIAKKLESNVSAIYGLQFNALRDLQKILAQNRDKFYEGNIEDDLKINISPKRNKP